MSPLDPNIALGGFRPVQPVDPMQTMAQVMALQSHQQNQAYQAERIELQRQEEARLQAAAERKVQDDADLRAGQAAAAPYQLGQVTFEEIAAGVNQIPNPTQKAHAVAAITKWRNDSSEIAARETTAGKNSEEIKKLRIGQIAGLGRSIRDNFQYSPEAIEVGFRTVRAENIMDPEVLDFHYNQWKQNPDPAYGKALVDSWITRGGEAYTLGATDTRMTPTGGVEARGTPAPIKPERVEQYDPVTKETRQVYVNPTLGASFLQRPPQAEGGGPVNSQLTKGIDPKTGQNVWLVFNPRTQKLEQAQTSFQPEQNVSEALPTNWKSTFDLAAAGLTRDKRENYERQINQALNASPEQQQGALRQIVKRAAIDSENVAAKNDINGRGQMISALSDVEKGLIELKEAGVDSNWFTGTAEGLLRRLGTSQDERLVRLGVRLETMLSNYTRAMSGVQFSEEEAKRYKSMFPNYKNTFEVNIAQIQGLRDDMAAQDRTYWEGKLGAEGARTIGIPAGSFSLSGTGETTAPPTKNPYR